MSENRNPQDGMPNPYGDTNRYTKAAPESAPPPLYFDPPIPATPAAGFNNQPAQSWGSPTQEGANTKATLALVLGIVSFFFLGVILSIPGYFLAKQAELLNGENAKVARIVNLISIGVNILGAVFFILILIFGIAGTYATR